MIVIFLINSSDFKRTYVFTLRKQAELFMSNPIFFNVLGFQQFWKNPGILVNSLWTFMHLLGNLNLHKSTRYT